MLGASMSKLPLWTWGSLPQGSRSLQRTRRSAISLGVTSWMCIHQFHVLLVKGGYWDSQAPAACSVHD